MNKFLRNLLITAGLLLTSVTNATIITTTVTGSTNNCIPFDCLLSYEPSGFVYKNISALNLDVGDTISFDMLIPNQEDIIFDVYLLATPNGDASFVNPSYLSLPWTKVSSAFNAGRGDSISGNFDLTFILDQAFSFAGGGLAIMLDYVGSDPDTYTNVPSWATTDGSSFAVEQFYTANGSYGDRASIIAAVRFNDEVTGVPEPLSVGLFGLALISMCRLRKR